MDTSKRTAAMIGIEDETPEEECARLLEEIGEAIERIVQIRVMELVND